MKNWFVPFLIFLISYLFLGSIGYFICGKIQNDQIQVVLKAAAKEGKAKLSLKESIIKTNLYPIIQDILYLKEKTKNGFDGEGESLKKDLINFAQSKENIDQIRFLDTNGHETFRINKVKDQINIVPQKFLQDKSDRPYFIQSLKLDTHEIYISELDLNMEHHKIQLPLVPTIRLVSCFYNDNKKIGELVVNYNMSDLLSSFQKSGNGHEQYFIVRKDFSLLSAPSNKGCFSFMFPGKVKTLFTEFPYIEKPKSKKNKLIKTDQGIQVIHHIEPYSWFNERNLKEKVVTPSDNIWGLVYFLPLNEVIIFLNDIHKTYLRNLYFLAISLSLLALLVLVMWKKRKDRIKQLLTSNIEFEVKVKERTFQLNEKINHITESLRYAKKVQETIFPQKKFIKSYFEQSFIFYQPKDIVAGDFYWMRPGEKKEEVIFAVGDCTGHGVPGAMISLICINSLNKAVKIEKKYSPEIILNRVSELVEAAFMSDNDTDITDGMDISLFSFNLKTRELKWSGANLPLWLVRTINNGKDQELLEIRGTRNGIGGNINQIIQTFEEHRFILEPDDILYLFTDGFQDQFSGVTNKKMRRSHFKETILKASKIENLNEQKEFLSNFFEEWRENSLQVDDVTLIGIKPGTNTAPNSNT